MKSVGSQQFGRRSGLWTCSCGGRSDDGRSERVNEGVDCGVKIALSFVLSSYPMLLDVALYGCSVGVQWYSTESACCGKARIARNGWVQMGWTGQSHIAPTSHAVIPLISSDAALCNWP